MNQEFFKYVRHLSMQDRKTLSQKTLKVGEEFGELAKATLPYDNAHTTTHRFVEREKILEEAIDTVLTAISIPYALEFTDEEIEAMLIRKAEKWAQLQINEADIKYPLPYEIHITVQTSDIERFRDTCKDIGVKPIIIDLQNDTGGLIMQDVMTSSKHFGDNRSAYETANAIKLRLLEKDFDVVRVKIETVPWHPAAPRRPRDEMPKNCYFEAHLAVTVHEAEIPLLRKICKNIEYPLHVSQNIFKRRDDNNVVIMVTYRKYDGYQGQFKNDVYYITGLLADFEIGKPITEFSVYDTKVSHDAAWLTTDK